jgi:hypothetical protein
MFRKSWLSKSQHNLPEDEYKVDSHPEQHRPVAHLLLTIGPQVSPSYEIPAGAGGAGGIERVGSQLP